MAKSDKFKELSLRPFHGLLFTADTKKEYERAHIKLFKTKDKLTSAMSGRFAVGSGPGGMWTYLVYASSPHILAHEFAHVLFHVFGRCVIDPRDSGGEVFCYMLSQLLLDAQQPKEIT